MTDNPVGALKDEYLVGAANESSVRPHPLVNWHAGGPSGRDDSDSIFGAVAYQRNLPHRRFRYQAGAATGGLERSLPRLDWVALHSIEASKEAIVGGTKSVTILAKTDSEGTRLRVAGHTAQIADTYTDDIWRTIETTIAEPDEGSVRFRFRSHQGGHTTDIPCPAWSQISQNYMPETRSGVAHLMDLDEIPAETGRLIVWHGPPGTGKTTAIRALSRQWNSWCHPHYITDPEKFFNDADYLTRVVSQHSLGHRGGDPVQLLIAEDCDDYLQADARLRAGVGLGRLLNLTDGILGLAYRQIVLITTNEPLRRLHPALDRPGRVLNDVGFTPFTPEAAHQWGLSGATSPMSLAEMYAASRGEAPARHGSAPNLGFRS